MVKIGDKIVLKKEMGALTDIGSEYKIYKIIDEDGKQVIWFKFGLGDAHLCVMSEEELERYFTVVTDIPSVKEENVDEMIKNAQIQFTTVFDKCTVAYCKLENGFIFVESSACVSADNYDFEIGKKICLNKIKDRIWELEGYVLQKSLYEKKIDDKNSVG